MTMIDLEYDSEFERNQQLMDIFSIFVKQLIEDNEESTLEWLNDKIDDLIGDYWPMKGHVYVIYVGRNLYKIGKSFDLKRRIKELKEQRVVRIIKTKDITKTEKHFHNRFNQRRLTESQELFALTDEDLVYIHNYPDEKLSDNLSLF